MPFKTLFTPFKIGKMKLKNRLVMPPMVRNYADKNGMVTRQYLDHIKTIAEGGVGMMVLEASFISQDGRGFANQLGIHRDACIKGIKALAAAAHKNKAKIGVQIYHAGRQTLKATTGTQTLAPSAIPDPLEQEMPKEMSAKEIGRVVKDFAAAARRTKKAGCDFVEIHGAHGYLINQFLSPFSNRREDQYGGTQDKRNRFMLEVIAAVRAAVGPSFPVTIRFSADEMVEGGLGIAEMAEIAKVAEAAGIDAIHVSAGVYGSYIKGYMIAPMASEDGLLVKYAKKIKQTVSVPVIAVGKLRSPQLCEKVIKSGAADLVAIGRALLADPEWPNKVKKGKIDSINKCVACNQGCISRLFAGQDVRCTVNPVVSRETLFAKKPNAAKRVLVVGGGPAGLSAAKYAADRGHKVTLFEKEKRLGGQLHAAANLPHRHDWEMFYETMVRDLKRAKVKIVTGKTFAPESIKNGEYDVAILATGSQPLRPRISGVEHENVILARHYNENKATASSATVIVGGGCQGAQTAESLALKNLPVTLVEMTKNIAIDAPIDERAMLMERLSQLGVKIMTETKVTKIGNKYVEVIGIDGAATLPAETVVLCMGAVSENEMAAALKDKIKKVTVVGDASSPRRITDAVAEGALAALAV
jgi:2,4-dienoyl-CoA reductase-like NADH-dependent reductase (Old Yellow Enzyme family)/thioredoxin reductase